MGNVDSDPFSREIETALMGGYPLEFAQPAAALTTVDIVSCPTGVWRVVMLCVGYGALSAAAHVQSDVRLLIRRDGVEYTVAVARQDYNPANPTTYNWNCWIERPLILRPGDTLLVRDIQAVANNSCRGTAGYIDIPIHTDKRSQKATRRG